MYNTYAGYYSKHTQPSGGNQSPQQATTSPLITPLAKPNLSGKLAQSETEIHGRSFERTLTLPRVWPKLSEIIWIEKDALTPFASSPPCYVPCYIFVLFVHNARNNPSLLFYIRAVAPSSPCYVPCYISFCFVLFVRNARYNPSLSFYIRAV